MPYDDPYYIAAPQCAIRSGGNANPTCQSGSPKNTLFPTQKPGAEKVKKVYV